MTNLSPPHSIICSPKKRLLNWLLYSSTWLALAAAAQTAATWRHLPGGLRHPAAWPTVALVGAATLLAYNLDAVLPYKFRQPAGTSARKAWQQRHRRALAGLAGAAALAVAGCLLAGGWLARPPRLLLPLGLAGLALGYSLPLLPWRGRWRAVREVPLLKVFLIAGVWSLVTVGLPTLAAGQALGAARELLAQQFCLVAALAIVFDIRDVGPDRAAGLRTFPAVLSVGGARAVAAGLLAASVALGLASGAAAGAVLLSAALAAVVIGAAQPTRGDYFFALLTDGVLLAQAVARWLS